MPRYNDYPIEECAHVAKQLVDQGATVHQKFTCSNCGRRITMHEPNKFFITGHCDDCGQDTDIGRKGCNYMVIAPALSMLPAKGNA